MKALIVDDEVLARLAITTILKDYFKEIEIIGECEGVPEAVRMINMYQPDVVFLDIEMSEYNGFDLLSFFPKGQINFHIIFVTAFNEYALQAFETSAVDYLLKPVRVEQIERALQKITKFSHKNLHYQILQENLENNTPKQIVLHTLDDVFVVKLQDIVCLQADGSYTKFIVTNQNKPILISKNLSEFQYLEKIPMFFRSGRSFIINIEKIKRIDKKEQFVEMENNYQVDIATNRKNILIEKLSKM
jgi:two-component system LytT family response regulator